MLTEDDIRRLAKIKVENNDALSVFSEHKKVFAPLLKLMNGHNPTQIYDDVQWLIELIERESGINLDKAEATIPVMQAFRVRKKNREKKQKVVV